MFSLHFQQLLSDSVFQTKTNSFSVLKISLTVLILVRRERVYFDSKIRIWTSCRFLCFCCSLWSHQRMLNTRGHDVFLFSFIGSVKRTIWAKMSQMFAETTNCSFSSNKWRILHRLQKQKQKLSKRSARFLSLTTVRRWRSMMWRLGAVGKEEEIFWGWEGVGECLVLTLN